MTNPPNAVPDISVILSVYNTAPFLKQCLNSIVNQTLTNIEIICVDDSSEDGSYEILREFAAADKRVIVIRQEHAGAGKARNTGLAMAKGKYLSILDSDDYFEQDMLECAFKAAEENHAQIVIYRADFFNQSNYNFEPCSYSIIPSMLPENNPFSAREIADHIFNIGCGWAWDKLFRRSFVKESGIRFQEIRTSNDMFFVFFLEGFSGVISEVILRGCNNHVTFDENPVNTKNLSLDLSSNANICFGKKCSFNGRLRLSVKRDSGFGMIEIKDGCRFGSGVLKIFNSLFQTMLQINDSCTFDDGLEIVASAGKKICIGRDSDFSKYIGIFAGDEHTVFDVCTGRSMDSVYQGLSDEDNQLLIGEHVLFAKGAFVMNGTRIGNGSIVGANSVVKGVFPNNCYIAGNPAAIFKRDIAWSREIYAADIKKCGRKEYYAKTMEE